MVCRPGHENDPLEKMRHSCAHVMADAVQKIFPEAKITIGPVIEDGFFYDFDFPRGFTPEDLKKIEAKMEEIIGNNFPFERKEIGKEEARELFKKRGENFKLEIIDGITDPKVSLYTHGDFTDLCKGPHVSTTGEIKAFKLLKVSGAYWRGDEKNPMLQRIYGTAFDSKEDLENYLRQMEEAQKRDHRKLGQQLDLYEVNPSIGGGLILWHPKGSAVRMVIEDFLKRELVQGGYDFVTTPHLGRAALWEKSGHLEFFKENMYAPMDVEGQAYFLKPMNCPFHISIFSSSKKSYRELPVRLAEFGTVYRYERSGVLHGLTRVRGFTQDDAHIFCTPDQALDEIVACLKMGLKVFKAFGLNEYKACVATKPPEVVGSEADWTMATNALKNAVELLNIPYEMDEGGGAFYGPKIDLKVKDGLGRLWQLSTIQFDFNLPHRFKIGYQGMDGKIHQPYMIHRALLGSFERFFGILIEHYAGAFPVWLSPIQAVVLNITEGEAEYARQVFEVLRRENVRVDWDGRGEKLGLKIRDAELKKIPYMLVVGAKEVQGGTVSVRSRGEGSLGTLTLKALIEKIQKEVVNFK